MKLNGLDLISWGDRNNKVSFILRGSVLSDAADLTGTFIVTEDDGSTQVAVFAGYTIIGITLESGNTVIHCIREIEDAAEDAIAGLDANVKILTQKVNTAEQNVSDLYNTVNAVSASVNPEVSAFARIVLPTMTASMTTADICSVVSLLPEWKVGASYKKNDAFTYEGKVYRVAQDIPEAQEQYKPGVGMESLYALIEIADDGIRVWKQPTDATNSFAMNERAHYPTATDPIYVSKRDGNTSIPGTDKWWVLEV